MKNTLDSYIEEVNEIFHYTKKEYEFDKFSKTCQRKFTPNIDICQEESIATIKKIFNSEGDDPIVMLDIINFIQEQTKNLFIELRVADQLWQDKILSINPDLKIDSTIVKGNFNKDFNIFIK